MKNILRILVLALVACCVSLCASASLVVTEDDGMTFYTTEQEESAELFDENAELIPLDAPTNLKWNVDANGKAANGYVSCDAVENCEGSYKITLYRDKEPVYSAYWESLYDHDGDGRVGGDVFKHDAFSKSGTYYFTVVARGDKTKYDDSQAATSEEYQFECPDTKLETPTQLEWVEFGVIRHKAVDNAMGYIYTFYNGQDSYSWRFRTCFHSGPIVDGYKTTDLTWHFEDIAGRNKNINIVYVTVKALTPDIELYMNSDESGYSAGLDIEKNTIIGKNELSNVMGKLDSGEVSASEAVDEFKDALEDKDISNSALATSMQQDEELVDNIALLENKFKNETGVETDIVDNSGSYLDDKGIDVSDIQMVGAALNSEDGNNVSLVFDTPDPSISLDPLFYKNAVGIGIDMEGVTDNQNLEIPIQIKMPVPANVLPERLIIVHCHKDGSQETIHPAVEQTGGKYYAKFVLTSFSTFIFCNESDGFKLGDLNGDSEVDMNDAILLLQYSMFPELYPIDYSGSLDLTDDGNIDINDAILLLQHSMFPELYPIS